MRAVTDKPTVLIVGAGAIGAFYGSILARQGARVSVVCRSDFDVVSKEGFAIKSAAFGDYTFRPERVAREVADYDQAPDYLILTVKVLEGEDRAALIRPAVGANTAIVLIENGIDIEPAIAEAFPHNELLSCLAFVAVSRLGPGLISHQSYGDLTLGKYPSGTSAAARRLGALWEAGGVQCQVVDDVVSARWHKTVWNAAFNPISIMGGTLTTAHMLASTVADALIRRVMVEICAVAAAEGHPQPPNLIDDLIANTNAMPPYKTSMALDYENGRPMELEAIVGNVLRAARRSHVPVPALDTIYAIAKMIEHKERQKRTETSLKPQPPHVDQLRFSGATE